MDIKDVIYHCKNKSIQWSNHALTRMMQRNITSENVIQILINGKIIEQYPDDYPYPSCLICGIDKNQKYVHVVCGIGENKLWIITAYYPNIHEWGKNFTIRR